ncbi:MAG: hypothetical protein EXR80_08585 [Methylococcales bacterium]|nr:hypothetical protein [Methylococcales bacterium]
MKKNGHNERGDHRSLKDQGIIDREPEKHLSGAGVRNTTAKNNLLELRAANTENQQATAEAAPLFEQEENKINARDLATNAADKFKAKLAERAEIKYQAERQRQRLNSEKYLADQAKAAADKLRQEQADRDKAERKARDRGMER